MNLNLETLKKLVRSFHGLSIVEVLETHKDDLNAVWIIYAIDTAQAKVKFYLPMYVLENLPNPGNWPEATVMSTKTKGFPTKVGQTFSGATSTYKVIAVVPNELVLGYTRIGTDKIRFRLIGPGINNAAVTARLQKVNGFTKKTPRYYSWLVEGDSVDLELAYAVALAVPGAEWKDALSHLHYADQYGVAP